MRGGRVVGPCDRSPASAVSRWRRAGVGHWAHPPGGSRVLGVPGRQCQAQESTFTRAVCASAHSEFSEIKGGLVLPGGARAGVRKGPRGRGQSGRFRVRGSWPEILAGLQPTFVGRCPLCPGFRPLIPQQPTFWTRPAKTGYDPKETLTLLLSATDEHLGFASGSVPRSRTQRNLSLPPCASRPTSPHCPAMLRSARPARGDGGHAAASGRRQP